MKERDLQIVTIDTIVSLPRCKRLKYIGGRNGALHPVRGVHYIEDFGYIDSIKKHSLIITAGFQHKKAEEIEHFWEMLHRRECAGIIVYKTRDGILPHQEKISQIAERLKIPVFAMPHEIPLSEIIEIVSEELFQSRKIKKSMAAFLLSLIDGEFKTNEDAFISAYISGYLKKESFVCAVIKFSLIPKLFTPNGFRNEIDNIVYSVGQKHKKVLPYLLNYNEMIMMIPLQEREDEEFAHNMVSDITQEVYRENISGKVSFGISRHCLNLMEFKNAFIYAKKIADFAFFMNKRYMTIKEREIFTVFMKIESTKVLEELYYSILGKLIEYDRNNQTMLLNTLISFVEKKFNTSDTAEALFIHPNTLRYRLDKIQEILQIKLRDPVSVYHTSLSVDIANFLDFIQKQNEIDT